MKQLSTADALALVVCRQLYEDTDGLPMGWRRPVGGYSIQTAVEYGVDNGWLLFASG
jgi:hypothetical protein